MIVYTDQCFVSISDERGGEGKLYHFNIELYNMANVTALVQYNEFNIEQEIRVLPLGTQVIETKAMLTDNTGLDLVARSELTGSQLYLNGLMRQNIYGSESKGERYIVNISEQGRKKLDFDLKF